MANDLKDFDCESLQSFYPEDESARVRNAAGLEDDRKYTRRVENRTFLKLLHVANAAQHLEHLPKRGESIHCVMRGNYNSFDLIPATLKLAAPATIAELHVSTMGYNRENADELLSLIDQQKIARVSFLCAHYYKSTTPDLFDLLYVGLRDRGQRFGAARTHAKVIAMRLSDGRPLVIESSANLRSCRNAEQFCMSQDEGLLAFHQDWITELLTEAGA